MITGAAVLTLIAPLIPLVFVVSDSACPTGLYISNKAKLERGTLVEACLPDKIALDGVGLNYIEIGRCTNRTEPVVKQVVALAGDVVVVDPRFVSVNGKPLPNSAVLPVDRIRRHITHVAFGTHKIETGQVWLMGLNNARSWDSRYYGSVPEADVLARLSPLMTW